MIKYVEVNGAAKILVEVELELSEPIEQPDVAAASYKGFNVPEGPLLSGLPDAIADSQAIADYEAFIESVQDLITDYYDLKIYYKNSSPDHSYYFGMLAQDADGRTILDFDFTLRISNHPAHRSQQSQFNKKERKAELARLTDGKKTKPITKSIIVNKEVCKDYEEAYQLVDSTIESVVKIMKRSSD